MQHRNFYAYKAHYMCTYIIFLQEKQLFTLAYIFFNYEIYNHRLIIYDLKI